MNEQELFLAALEIDDPAERQVHVQTACADDLELLARVESLLASHESQSQFLNTPVVDQMVDEAVSEADATLLYQNGSTQDDEFESADFNPDEREAATIELTKTLVPQGIWGVRVHSVKPHVDVIAGAK